MFIASFITSFFFTALQIVEMLYLKVIIFVFGSKVPRLSQLDLLFTTKTKNRLDAFIGKKNLIWIALKFPSDVFPSIFYPQQFF